MTASNQVHAVPLPDPLVHEVLALGHCFRVPGWTFAEWPHPAEAVRSAIAVRPELHRFLQTVRAELEAKGHVVVGMGPLLDSGDESLSAGAVTAVLATLGTPLRVFLRHPHWRPLGVDTDRPANRSGGVGLNTLHMDFVNAENPPDYVCLFCIRPDPAGGGTSLVASIPGVEAALSASEAFMLREARFRDGMVQDLAGVGRDANPFAVLEPGAPWSFRFATGLLESTSDPDERAALQSVAAFLEGRLVRILLNRGDLLILDQHQVTHGREPLGGSQVEIPIERRRFLYHSFVRR